jgi:arylsulfatase
LPGHQQPFADAKIGRTYKDSKPGAMTLAKAPAGAPNILIILIDDSGFGQWGTFGGQVPTPNLDRLAQMGLRYTRFHTTALCSPTRAALLTGRNHHSAGTGVITEMGDGFPGYSGQIPKSTAMFAEVLRQGGYSTAFIGKNHNIADWETSTSGPLIGGQASRASTISTVSLAARWISGNPSCTGGRRPYPWRFPRAEKAATR